MTRALAILILLGSTSLASSWPGIPYTRVRAYAYNPENGPRVKDRSGHVLMYETIWHDGKLATSAVNKSGTLLSATETERLIRAITMKPPETVTFTNCFDPHYAFVFYDAHRKAVAWVEVCFHCGNIQAPERSWRISLRYESTPQAQQAAKAPKPPAMIRDLTKRFSQPLAVPMPRFTLRKHVHCKSHSPSPAAAVLVLYR
jgi:hypothetical protein